MDPLKAARNQDLFRTVNERIKNFDGTKRRTDFVCECARPECQETITMSLNEYEVIRRVPTHFLVVASARHAFPDIERVVDTGSGYWVVEKFGRSGLETAKRDPRRGVDRAAS